jgi:hypothetical protein
MIFCAVSGDLGEFADGSGILLAVTYKRTFEGHAVVDIASTGRYVPRGEKERTNGHSTDLDARKNGLQSVHLSRDGDHGEFHRPGLAFNYSRSR